MPDKKNQRPIRETANQFLRIHGQTILANLQKNKLYGSASPRLRAYQSRFAGMHLARETLLNHDRFCTLFYPCCGSDWQPLKHLNQTCDLFIFCDWGMEPSAVPDNLAIPGLSQVVSVDLDLDTVSYLSDDSLLPKLWRDKMVGHQGAKPWGKCVSFDRTDGNLKGLVHAFFLGMEAVTLFANLFLPVKAAPEVLCLWNAGGMAGPIDFHSINEPLGQLVSECSLWPRYLVGDKGNWQYPKPVKLVRGRSRALNQRFRAFER